jgi:hypothetical protein
MEPLDKKIMRALFVVILLIFTSSAFGKEWNENISCGNAIVDLSITEAEEGIKIWDVELKARSKFQKEYKSILRYDQVYFSYSCKKTKNGKDVFVYKAYCSGSGCSDSSNWGVIGSDGKLLLVPYADNTLWKDFILQRN